MRLAFALRIPAIGEIVGEVAAPCQAGAGEAERAGQAALKFGGEVEAEPSLEAELKERNAFARVGIARAGVEMDAQLPVRLQEGEVRETRGVIERHARRDRAPALVACQIAPIPVAW